MLYWDRDNKGKRNNYQIINGASIGFTKSIIRIPKIPRTIIQSCMGGSGWFAKGTKLSWIPNYCVTLVKIRY